MSRAPGASACLALLLSAMALGACSGRHKKLPPLPELTDGGLLRERAVARAQPPDAAAPASRPIDGGLGDAAAAAEMTPQEFGRWAELARARGLPVPTLVLRSIEWAEGDIILFACDADDGAKFLLGLRPARGPRILKALAWEGNDLLCRDCVCWKCAFKLPGVELEILELPRTPEVLQVVIPVGLQATGLAGRGFLVDPRCLRVVHEFEADFASHESRINEERHARAKLGRCGRARCLVLRREHLVGRSRRVKDVEKETICEWPPKGRCEDLPTGTCERATPGDAGLDGPRGPGALDGPRGQGALDGPRGQGALDGPRGPGALDGPRGPGALDGPRRRPAADAGVPPPPAGAGRPGPATASPASGPAHGRRVYLDGGAR
jgi:hypothetical protein